jgi:hypothetical protein
MSGKDIVMKLDHAQGMMGTVGDPGAYLRPGVVVVVYVEVAYDVVESVGKCVHFVTQYRSMTVDMEVICPLTVSYIV